MLYITASQLTEQEVIEHEIDCDSVDYAAIFAAEQRNSSTFEGCSQTPVYAVSFKPAEDMVIPFFVCHLHFNALKISLFEGVAVDENAFGEFPKENNES